MAPRSILYHDVVEPGRPDDSGFPGPAAGRYKLVADEFVRHMEALGQQAVRVVLAPELCAAPSMPRMVCLTFDDGGRSAWTHIAPELERRGWKAHFFVTTDCVGTRSFLNPDRIRELRRQGHVVGSHSASHPIRMSYVSPNALFQEWDRSVKALSNWLQEPVLTGSVPGGFYSRAVAEAADRAGIRYLFTSEPVARVWTVGNCRVLGRYTVWQGMTPKQAAGLAVGRRAPCWKQWAYWNLKKTAKACGGQMYLRWRDYWAGRR